MALHPVDLAKSMADRPGDWKHTVTRMGEVVSLSFEGAEREIEAERARWFKAAWLRGER